MDLTEKHVQRRTVWAGQVGPHELQLVEYTEQPGDGTARYAVEELPWGANTWQSFAVPKLDLAAFAGQVFQAGIVAGSRPHR